MIEKNKKPILVNGGGVVGLRVAQAMLYCGYEVDIAINSMKANNPRTKLVKNILSKFPETRILSTPTQPELTHQQARVQKVRICDVVSENSISNYSLIIDCAHKKGTLTNYETLYSKNPEVPVILQGASAYDLYSNDFVMEKNTIGFIEPQRFSGKSCRKVSCNATYSSLMLGMVLDNFNVNEIKGIETYLFRRHQDPEDQKPEILKSTPIDYGEDGIGTKHAKDILQCIPSLEGKLKTYANKNPWKHYHRVETIIEFEKNLNPNTIHDLQYSFRDNPRTIYLDEDLGNGDLKTMEKVTNNFIEFFERKLKIPDGDCHLGIYNVSQIDANKIKISGYNPQRSVVVLNHIDHVHLSQGMNPKEAWDATNNHASIYGNTPGTVKLLTEAYFNQKQNRF